jgi:hypothetical protein
MCYAQDTHLQVADSTHLPMVGNYRGQCDITSRTFLQLNGIGTSCTEKWIESDDNHDIPNPSLKYFSVVLNIRNIGHSKWEQNQIVLL